MIGLKKVLCFYMYPEMISNTLNRLLLSALMEKLFPYK